MPKSSKLVFFGSGTVGRATLEALRAAGFEFEVIITKPKPAHHHGPMPVLDFGNAYNIPTLTPKNAAELSNLFNSRSFNSRLGLLVDYGIILAKRVIKSFPKAIVNSHFSLLPQWRGADPITFAILSGQKQTGVSLMLINEKLDEGLLLAQEALEIAPDANTSQLTNQLTKLSNDMLIKAIPRYLSGEIKPYSQPDEPPTYSRRLAKEDGAIDWSKPAVQLEREVRAYLGWPKSQAKIFGHDVIITKTRIAKDKDDGDLVISCQPAWLEIQELVAPSGRTMSGADFLRGYKK